MSEDNFLQPADDTAVGLVNPEEQMPGLAAYVKGKFDDAENGRFSHEQKWLQAYKNFRGIYDSTTQYRDSERSQVFIRITKTKVLAAFGQIVDILFANKKFPLVVESTPVPEGIAEFAHMETPLDQMDQQDPYGFAGDGRELSPGALQAEEPKAFLGGLEGEYGKLPITEGRAKMGEPQIEPAKIAALNMEKMAQVSSRGRSTSSSAYTSGSVTTAGNESILPKKRVFHALRWYPSGTFTPTPLPPT